MLSHLAPAFPPLPLVPDAKHRNQYRAPSKPGDLESLQSMLPEELNGCRAARTEGKLCRQNLSAATPCPHLNQCHLCY